MKENLAQIYSSLLKQQCVFEVNDNKVIKRTFCNVEGHSCHLVDGKIIIYYGDELGGYFDIIIGINPNGELILKDKEHGNRYLTTARGWYIYVCTYGKQIFLNEKDAEKALLPTHYYQQVYNCQKK